MRLIGKLDGDDVSIVPTGVFGTADVGNNKKVTISYSELSGTDAGNYSFNPAESQGETTANITRKPSTSESITLIYPEETEFIIIMLVESINRVALENTLLSSTLSVIIQVYLVV